MNPFPPQQPLPPHPGWFIDPWHPDYVRWFDGFQWTPETQRAKKKTAIIGPLIILGAIVAAVVFALLNPSVDVPLGGGSQDCGASSFGLGTGFDRYTSNGGDTTGLVDSLQQQCKSKAQHNITIGGVILVVGLIGGGVISGRERRR